MPEVIHVFSEQDSKGSLLAEVHRLQGSLAAMRQARDFHGANSAYLMRERDRLQKEIEEMRERIDFLKHIKTIAAQVRDGGAHAPVDAGLIERMMDAARVDKDDWRSYCSDDRSLFIKGMTAALRVAADALLGPATIDEWMAVTKSTSFASSQAHWDWDRVQAFLAARRTRLLAPEKSAEERVRIEQRSCGDGSWEVWEDENYCGNHSERNAKALRLGLIAALKQEAKP